MNDNQKREQTASKEVKARGMKSLRQMVRMTDTNEKSLKHYFVKNPKRFEMLLRGCLWTLEQEDLNDKDRKQ